MTNACGPWQTIEHIGDRYRIEAEIIDHLMYLVIRDGGGFDVVEGWVLKRGLELDDMDSPWYPKHIAVVTMP
jgi:hypothetical protein